LKPILKGRYLHGFALLVATLAFFACFLPTEETLMTTFVINADAVDEIAFLALALSPMKLYPFAKGFV
jgi:hypothetical protein